jgi:hypothetical protein
MNTSASTLAPKTSWIDENTRREVSIVTDEAWVGYFRSHKHLPDGRVLVAGGRKRKQDRAHSLLAIDPATGDIETLDQPAVGFLRIRQEDGKAWFMKGWKSREVWEVDLPYGTPKLLCKVPDSVPGNVADITCDGKTLILEEQINEAGAFPIPTTMSADDIWRYINRQRHGAIYTYDVASNRVGRIVHMPHVSPAHSEASPIDPTLVRYTQDVLECAGQRMFTIRTDGSEQRTLRQQEYGEMITHEFWWSDPNYVGYTYMDRRGDQTVHEFPWCEYAKRPTHLGICDLKGNEVYLSDPLNSYHAHLYMSPNGQIVCGEGTAWNNFICAGAFSWKTTRLDLVPLATIHTEWLPTRGCGTNCGFSKDGGWLLYNDTIDGKHYICRVKVDV